MLTVGARVKRDDGVTVKVVSVHEATYVLDELDGPSWPTQRFHYVVPMGTELTARARGRWFLWPPERWS